MSTVRVPRKNVTPAEVVSVLGRRLGPQFQVQASDRRCVVVRKSALACATISIADRPGASVFRVHGGGFLRVTGFGTARHVTDALRRSPEFRSL